jgi:hypothetical protein
MSDKKWKPVKCPVCDKEVRQFITSDGNCHCICTNVNCESQGIDFKPSITDIEIKVTLVL